MLFHRSLVSPTNLEALEGRNLSDSPLGLTQFLAHGSGLVNAH